MPDMSDRAKGYPYLRPFLFARISGDKEVARNAGAMITSCAKDACVAGG